MGLFAAAPQAPNDPILGVTIAFNNDTHPDKLNLGVGAYRTEVIWPLTLLESFYPTLIRQSGRQTARARLCPEGSTKLWLASCTILF